MNARTPSPATDGVRQAGGRVIVVGAGISGMTAAWRLQQLGHDVTVLEAGDHVGGKIASVRRDGFRIGRGAGVYAGSYKAFLGVVRDAGLQDEIIELPTTVGVMRGGKVHWLRGSGLGAVIDFVKTPLISGRSKLLLRRLALDVFRARRSIGFDDAARLAELDTETVEEYCDRRLNRELRDHLLVPLLNGVWVLDGAKMSVADLYVLIAKFLGGGLLGYKDGIDFLPRALAERMDVRCGARVTLVAADQDGGGARVTWEQGGSTHEERVAGVILSLPASRVPDVHPGLEPDLQGMLLEGLKQANYAVMRFALNQRPDSDGTFLAVPEGELRGVGSIAFEHNISPGAAPAGKGLLGVFLSAGFCTGRLELSDEELITEVLPDLDLVVPGIADMIEFVEITRWTPATLLSEVGCTA